MLAIISAPASAAVDNHLTHGDGPGGLYAFIFLVQPALVTAAAGVALRQRACTITLGALSASVVGAALWLLLIYLAARAGLFE